MSDAVLEMFRELAELMLNPTGEAKSWQWIGPHMSQRMFDLTEQRAKDYAKRFGGRAERMKSE